MIIEANSVYALLTLTMLTTLIVSTIVLGYRLMLKEA
jgi:hypothetical protein